MPFAYTCNKVYIAKEKKTLRTFFLSVVFNVILFGLYRMYNCLEKIAAQEGIESSYQNKFYYDR